MTLPFLRWVDFYLKKKKAVGLNVTWSNVVTPPRCVDQLASLGRSQHAIAPSPWLFFGSHHTEWILRVLFLLPVGSSWSSFLAILPPPTIYKSVVSKGLSLALFPGCSSPLVMSLTRLWDGLPNVHINQIPLPSGPPPRDRAPCGCVCSIASWRTRLSLETSLCVLWNSPSCSDSKACITFNYLRLRHYSAVLLSFSSSFYVSFSSSFLPSPWFSVPPPSTPFQFLPVPLCPSFAASGPVKLYSES